MNNVYIVDQVMINNTADVTQEFKRPKNLADLSIYTQDYTLCANSPFQND